MGKIPDSARPDAPLDINGEPIERQPRIAMRPLLDFDRCTNVSRFARTLGVHRREVYRWLAEGVPVGRADEFACRLGVHPSAVWGDSWWSL